MRIIFFGSDDFAVAHLKELVERGYEVAACIAQPDKPKGRGLQVAAPATKECALKYHIPVLQPVDLKEIHFQKKLKDLEADLFVVVAYGKILPREILVLPKLFCVNVHGSLLPKYRGAAPINWAIVNGDEITGISIIKMNEIMDGGDIIAQKELPIDSKDTSITLRAKMVSLGSKLLCEIIEKIRDNAHQCVAQNEKLVTLAPKLTKEHGMIDWNKDAAAIHRLVRGLLPWPAAFTHCSGKVLKILEADCGEGSFSKADCGKIISIAKENFAVATGKGVLLVRQVHLESAKPMSTQSFLMGSRIKEGFKLG
ncbi:MAG: methionyl-tRNA formyltransferase [Candidatus Omnitrophota bacterium]